MLNKINEINAVGIGFRRCASSCIPGYLHSHPEIAKPYNGTHYFSQNYSQGKNWFFNKFNYGDIKEKCIVECSVSYTYPEYYIESAKRIYNDFPNVKIFCAIRNPIHRAYSDYLRSIRNLEINSSLSFHDALIKYPVFLERGRYKTLLSPFYDKFDENKIKILVYDDLISHPSIFFDSLTEFLGIADFEYVKNNSQNENSGILKYPLLQKILLNSKYTFDFFAKVFRVNNFWLKTKKRFKSQYLYLRNFNTIQEGISLRVKSELFDYYNSDIDWISNKLNRDLSIWRNE